MTAVVACPTCGTKVSWNDEFPHRPFCSERCQLMDLGKWSSEEHKIPGNPNFDDINSDDLENEF